MIQAQIERLAKIVLHLFERLPRQVEQQIRGRCEAEFVAQLHHVAERRGRAERGAAHLLQACFVERLHAHAEPVVPGAEFLPHDVEQSGGTSQEVRGDAFERDLRAAEVERLREAPAQVRERGRFGEVGRAAAEVQRRHRPLKEVEQLPLDGLINLVDDFLHNARGLRGVAGLVRERAEAAARNGRVAERVRQHPDEQFAIREVERDRVFRREVRRVGLWHRACERVAVQEPVPLRAAHPARKFAGG